MYKVYFKQAIAMLKQNKFISIISIGGTALAIMMIMVIVVSHSVKNANLAPEGNRSRTLYLKYESKKNENNFRNSYIRYQTYKDYLSKVKSAEYISAFRDHYEKLMVSTENNREYTFHKPKMVDPNYWKIMTFNFVSGQAFDKDDFNTGKPRVVISEQLAKSLYTNADGAIGKTISIDYDDYLVCGVVKDVSPVFQYTYADIFMPYTCQEDYERDNYHILFLAKNKEDFEQIEKEVRQAEQELNTVDTEWRTTLLGPYNHKEQQLNSSPEEPKVEAGQRKTIFILIVLFLVPAFNLSGFSISRINERTEEIAIRKTFGAGKHTILMQVLFENLITKLLGGIIGLGLSYYVLFYMKRWLLGIEASSNIPLEALISFPIMLAIVLVCFILNILSSGVPAYKASRMNITDSINHSKNNG